ncbi:membrane hypothetical protein [Azospirillaceae bacterium]
MPTIYATCIFMFLAFANQVIFSATYFKRTGKDNHCYYLGGLVGLLTFVNISDAILSCNLSYSSWEFIVSSFLYLFSIFLFHYSAASARHADLTLSFSKESTEILVTSGPYRWVRHPFYSSYLIYWFAPTLLKNDILFSQQRTIALCILLLMFSIYRKAAIQEEQKFMSSDLAEQYRQYHSKVGRFVPKLWR